ncbi:phosphatases II [Penicillium brevicompactum]|uniref:protein-serine/threonine phosphatase n=1 Tax=Penicillium brevicompactum TaxID=5074 RepID=A0A9W9RDE9_PENBR|nr:phosphatases II [Penicillium brevicompactum]
MSEVTDHLYISGYEFASNLSELQRHRITHILNMSYEYDNAFPDEFTYMHIPAKDTLTERLGPWFHDIAAFVAEAKKSNGTTLVHCQLGISRSSTALLASLIINEELRLSSAFKLLKGATPDVEPNPTFLRELRALEREIHGECSLEKLTVLDQCKTPAPLDWKESIAIILASAAAADTP